MSTESETKSAGVPAGATHVCVKCGSTYRHVGGRWFEPVVITVECVGGCLALDLRPIAEAGPAPTTAAPAEQLSGKVAESYYGRDCPVGMVQVEFVGCPPEARYSEYGWKPTPHAFLEVWVDGKRFRVDVGDFEDGRARRRGLHIVTDAVGIAFEKTAMNAASIYLEKPDARPAEQPGKAADPRPAHPTDTLRKLLADVHAELDGCSANDSAIRVGDEFRQGHWCTHCDGDVDRNGELRARIRAMLAAEPQAPAEPTQEQIEKATAVVANLWGPKSLHVALVGKIAAALAAEAAPLREERDRLVGELRQWRNAAQETAKVLGFENDGPGGGLWFTWADRWLERVASLVRTEKAVAERDARIATLTRLLRGVLHERPLDGSAPKVWHTLACPRCEIHAFPTNPLCLRHEIAAALGAPEGQPPAPPQELLGKEGADTLRQALRDLREVQEHGSLDEEAGAALNGVEHRLLKLLPAGEPWPIPAPLSPEEQLSGKGLK